MEFVEFKLIFEQFKKNYWNWGNGYFSKKNFVGKVSIVCLCWDFIKCCLWFCYFPFPLGFCSLALSLFPSIALSSPQASEIWLLLLTKNYIVLWHQWPPVYQSKWRGFLCNFLHWPVLSLCVSLKKIYFLLIDVIYMISVESFETTDVNICCC